MFFCGGPSKRQLGANDAGVGRAIEAENAPSDYESRPNLPGAGRRRSCGLPEDCGAVPEELPSDVV